MANQNAIDQLRWAEQKADDKERAYYAALATYHSIPTARRNRKDDNDKKEAKRQAIRARNDWIGHVTLSDALPTAYDKDDPNEWIRKTKSGTEIPSMEDFCDIIGDAFIADKKVKDPDVKMPRLQRIEDIQKNLQTDGKHRLSTSPEDKSEATEKWECKDNFQYTPHPVQSDGTTGPPQPIERETGLIQWTGFLYERIEQFVAKDEKDTEGRNWAASQAWYRDKKGAKLDLFPAQPPVMPLEAIRRCWIEAHIGEVGPNKRIVHNGRDATYLRLMQGISSSITKILSGQFIDRCPGCRKRTKVSRVAAGKSKANDISNPQRIVDRDIRKDNRKRKAQEEAESQVAQKRQRANCVRGGPAYQQLQQQQQSAHNDDEDEDAQYELDDNHMSVNRQLYQDAPNNQGQDMPPSAQRAPISLYDIPMAQNSLNQHLYGHMPRSQEDPYLYGQQNLQFFGIPAIENPAAANGATFGTRLDISLEFQPGPPASVESNVANLQEDTEFPAEQSNQDINQCNGESSNNLGSNGDFSLDCDPDDFSWMDGNADLCWMQAWKSDNADVLN